MASILIVAHQPLASTLRAMAEHAYEESIPRVLAVDVASDSTLSEARQQVSGALAELTAPAGSHAEVLVLTDVFGATPCNAALAATDGASSRVVAGVNVSMLWRSLCYAQLPLAELVLRALEGGRKGIMQVVAPSQSHPSNPAPSDDQVPGTDQ